MVISKTIIKPGGIGVMYCPPTETKYRLGVPKLRNRPKRKPPSAPPSASRPTFVCGCGRPSILCERGTPEIILICSSLKPKSYSFSTALAAGSISSNKANKVASDMFCSILFELADGRDVSLAHFAQGMRHLPFLYFPDWDQRDQTGSDHVEQ